MHTSRLNMSFNYMFLWNESKGLITFSFFFTAPEPTLVRVLPLPNASIFNRSQPPHRSLLPLSHRRHLTFPSPPK